MTQEEGLAAGVSKEESKLCIPTYDHFFNFYFYYYLPLAHLSNLSPNISILQWIVSLLPAPVNLSLSM